MTNSGTVKVAGELQSLPVSTKLFTDVTVNFVGPHPLSEVFDKLVKVICVLTRCGKLNPCLTTKSAVTGAEGIHEGWHRLFSIPGRMVSNREKPFHRKFWQGPFIVS